VGALISRLVRSAPDASSAGAERRASWVARTERRLRGHRLELYVSLVAALGVATITFLVVRDVRAPTPAWLPVTPAVAVLAIFTFGSELRPIRMVRGVDVEEVTTSTVFAFAIVLLAGAAFAAYVLSFASAVSDISHRKPLRKILFNVGQYAFITAVAGGLYTTLGGPLGHDVRLGAFVVSAGVFFVLNTLMTGIAVGLSGDTAIVRHVRSELLFNATVASTLLSMAPVVALVAHRSVSLLLLFLLPVGAVQLAAKGTIERARLIEQLRGSLAHLTELNRAKDEFVAVVSHELRTPLTSVRGYVRTVLSLGDDLSSADIRSCLEGADRQAQRLQEQIERLLFVASLETRRHRLGALHLVSIRDVVTGILEDMSAGLNEHRVVLHADEDVPDVTTHEASVSHIVMNLVENAAKYSPPGSEIDVDLRREGDGVIVSVRDRGPGIPAEHRDRIFERFYQVDSSNTRAAGGTGLGLYIAASCAKDIGGRLWLERSDARGSEFCVQLPATPEIDAVDPQGPATAAVVERETGPSPSPSVANASL
jgi:signal transduction histidine kinase